MKSSLDFTGFVKFIFKQIFINVIYFLIKHMIYIAQCINELKKIVFRNNLAILQVVETVMAFFLFIIMNDNNCSLKNH